MLYVYSTVVNYVCTHAHSVFPINALIEHAVLLCRIHYTYYLNLYNGFNIALVAIQVYMYIYIISYMQYMYNYSYRPTDKKLTNYCTYSSSSLIRTFSSLGVLSRQSRVSISSLLVSGN